MATRRVPTVKKAEKKSPREDSRVNLVELLLAAAILIALIVTIGLLRAH